MTGRIDLSKWHTICWGMDGQVHNISLRTQMQKDEKWRWHQAHVAEIARIIQSLMGMAEEHMFEMFTLEQKAEKELNKNWQAMEDESL